LQLCLGQGKRQDRYLPFLQGYDGLLERPGIDSPVLQHRDQGALIGALIRSSVHVIRIECSIAYLRGVPTPDDTQYACLSHALPLSLRTIFEPMSGPRVVGAKRCRHPRRWQLRGPGAAASICTLSRAQVIEGLGLHLANHHK
jgi:hypothetical protein